MIARYFALTADRNSSGRLANNSSSTINNSKGLKNEPKRCKPCKQAKNERLAAIANAQASGVRQRIEVSVQCAQCGQTTTVPFYPSQGRPVYCRSCFIASRDADDY